MLIKQARIPIKDILIFGLLPGFLKKFIYRLKGYRIGSKVSIGFGSVICGKEVSVGEYTTIGFFTIIRGQSIKIGSHVSIGATTFLDTPFLEIGDDCKINEQVFVGGLQFPDSRFVLGKNCQVMQNSFINPAKSIIVGDDVGIGGESLIFGHTSWLSQFEGYTVDFAPIEIGNSVSISWRVFILPGTKIGDGSVIGANSLVHRTIPPKSLAVGFPIRVVSKSPDFPQKVTEDQKITILQNIVAEMIEYFNSSGFTCVTRDGDYEVTRLRQKFWNRRKKHWRLRVRYEENEGNLTDAMFKNLDMFLSLREIPKKMRRILNSKKIMWIDIEKKERPLFWNDLGDEVALYLKRYGVRLFRVRE